MNYLLGATQSHFSPSRWARVKRIFLPNDLTLCYNYYQIVITLKGIEKKKRKNWKVTTKMTIKQWEQSRKQAGDL